MKWENLEKFKLVERMIYQFEAQKEDTGYSCDHDFEVIDGHNTCTLCGLIDGIRFELGGDFTFQKPYKPYRPYEKFVYLRNLMRRVSGYNFVDSDKREVQFDEIPNSLTKIRKLLKERKMNMKNDFYYWRIKKGITTAINNNDISNWLTEYKKNGRIRRSPKKFLLNKMKGIDEYANLLPLVGGENDKKPKKK